MTLSEILRKSHTEILQVELITAPLLAHESEIQQIEETLQSVEFCLNNIPFHRTRLANLRGRLTNMILQLDNLSGELTKDKDTLLREEFMHKRGVTKVAISPYISSRPPKQSDPTLPQAKRQVKATKPQEPDLEKLRRTLMKNPALLAQLQQKIALLSKEQEPK